MKPLLAAAVLLAGCSIDDESGVALELEQAQIGSRESAVTVDVVGIVRVGEHAPGGEREVAIARAEVWSHTDGDHVLGVVNLDRVSGFDYRLSPGDEQELALHGETVPGAFGTMLPELCMAAPSDLFVNVKFEDRTGMLMEIATTSVASIDCNN